MSKFNFFHWQLDFLTFDEAICLFFFCCSSFLKKHTFPPFLHSVDIYQSHGLGSQARLLVQALKLACMCMCICKVCVCVLLVIESNFVELHSHCYLRKKLRPSVSVGCQAGLELATLLPLAASPCWSSMYLCLKLLHTWDCLLYDSVHGRKSFYLPLGGHFYAVWCNTPL